MVNRPKTEYETFLEVIVFIFFIAISSLGFAWGHTQTNLIHQRRLMMDQCSLNEQTHVCSNEVCECH